MSGTISVGVPETSGWCLDTTVSIGSSTFYLSLFVLVQTLSRRIFGRPVTGRIDPRAVKVVASRDSSPTDLVLERSPDV